MPKHLYPAAVDELIEGLHGLPGIGRRSAERLALAMIKWTPEKLAFFGSLISSLPERIGFCPECGNLAEGDSPCELCANPKRNNKIICVVEDFSQINTIEAANVYNGLYHVLGGRLSPLNNCQLEDLRIDELMTRLDKLAVDELILALSPDVEGRATALYLASLCEGKVNKITQPVQGLPAGANLIYADAATISAALGGRIAMK